MVPGCVLGLQCPRNASSSHHDPRDDVTLASMSSGRSRGPPSQSRDRAEIAGRPHGDALEAEAPPDRGDVGRREPDRIQRVAVRPEVMHLRAVRLVVVDHDHHRDPQPHHGLQLADAHQRASVAERGDRQPVRPRDRGPDGRGQAEPDRLERLGEAEARLVGDRQVHARVAHEVPGVDRHGPLRGQQVIERDGQRARIDPLPVAVVLERHVPPPHLPRDPLAQGR